MGGWLADEAARAVAEQFGPCRVALLWRNGASYDQPASIEITTAAESPAGPTEDVARHALTRTDWLGDLLSGRYLPRVELVEQLLDDLQWAGG